MNWLNDAQSYIYIYIEIPNYRFSFTLAREDVSYKDAEAEEAELCKQDF